MPGRPGAANCAQITDYGLGGHAAVMGKAIWVMGKPAPMSDNTSGVAKSSSGVLRSRSINADP